MRKKSAAHQRCNACGGGPGCSERSCSSSGHLRLSIPHHTTPHDITARRGAAQRSAAQRPPARTSEDDGETDEELVSDDVGDTLELAVVLAVSVADTLLLGLTLTLDVTLTELVTDALVVADCRRGERETRVRRAAIGQARQQGGQDGE